MTLSVTKRSFATSLGLCMFLLKAQAVFAITPVPALYAGLVLGGSYQTSSTLNVYNPITNSKVPVKLEHSFLGNIGGEVGYRFNHFRLEGELFINSNPYKSLKVGNYTLNKTGNFSTGYAMKGQTNIGALMINGFYDFFSEKDGSNFAPYVGIGVGYAYIMNNIKFYYNNNQIPNSSFSYNTSAPAAQGIVGFGHFLDNFTFVSLDFRYFTTKAISSYDVRPQVGSINFNVIGSFDCGF